MGDLLTISQAEGIDHHRRPTSASFKPVFRSRNLSCSGTVFPQLLKVQMFVNCSRHFQDDPSSVPDNLCRHIDQPAPKAFRIEGSLQHRGTDLLLEDLKEHKGEHHHIVKGGVGHKAVKRQLLKAEILKGPMHQLVAAVFMIGGNVPATDSNCEPRTASRGPPIPRLV